MRATPIATPPAESKMKAGLLAYGALVFAVTVVAYLPAIRAGFIWNDSDYVTEPALQSATGLWRIWTEVGVVQQYYPLLHSVFWLEHGLWGDSPAGYHLANILLHAMASCLFASVLRQLTVRGAWLAGLMFALHPVCVESVAWISEQKNTLSLVFFLAAALAYLGFDETPTKWRYRCATALYLCALFSKTTTAVLPPVLLVIAWWRRGKIEWRRDVWPLVPWFALGATIGLLSAGVEKYYIGAEGGEFTLSLLERVLLASRVVWFYFGKVLLPINLIFIYPRWTIDATVWWQWLFPVGFFAVMGMCWTLRHRSRGPLAVLLLFAGSLFPVIGFFNLYAFIFSYVADHWQYLPCLALIAPAAALLARAPKYVAFVLLGIFGVLTWRQTLLYADMETFYRETIARNPDCWMAHNNLGTMLRDAGRLDEAQAEYETTVRFRSGDAKAQTNLGVVYRDQHRLADAMPHYEAAVRIEPDNAVYQDNLAGALRDTGHIVEALPHHQAAVRFNPEYSDAHNNYGVTLRAMRRDDDARVQFEAAVRLDPKSAPARLNLMFSYWSAGRTTEARVHYLEARRLNPALPELDLNAPPRR